MPFLPQEEAAGPHWTPGAPKESSDYQPLPGGTLSTRPAGLAPQGETPLDITAPAAPFGQLLDAAMTRGNTLGSLAERLSRGPMSPPEPGFDPFGHIKGYEDYAASFKDANSLDDVGRIARSIDKERQRAALLDSGGALGMVAELAAGMADPVNLIPVGGELLAVGRLGTRIGAGALRTATAGGAAGVASEAALHATQDTRTMGESAVNVAAGTLLAGLMGGGLGAAVGRDLRPLARGVMRDSEAFANEVGANVPGGSLSAAATHDLTKEQESFTSALGLEKALSATSPILRLGNSDALATRRIGQDLAEQPLMYRKNAEGIATPISTEALIRQWQWPLAKSLSAVDDLFVQYRLGRQAKTGDALRIGIGDALGRRGDMLARSDFMEEVGRAMRRGDQHDVPEIAQAAAELRKTLFDPLKERAIAAGLLPENVDPATATSYLTRVYDREKLAAQRPEFENRVATWLEEEQAKKAEIQGKVAPLLEELAGHEDRIAASGKKVDRLTTRADELEARGEELTGLSKLSYQRAETVRQRTEAARAGTEDKALESARTEHDAARERLLRQDSQENRAAFALAAERLEAFEGTTERKVEPRAVARGEGAAQEGAVMETALRNRTNKLADQASGASHGAETAEQDIARREARIEAIREELEGHVSSWEGKTSRGAKAALAKRAEQQAGREARAAAEGASAADAERLRGADKAVIKSAEAIANAQTRLERIELEDIARQLTDRLLGSPVGRLPYDAPGAGHGSAGFSKDRPDDVVGSLKARSFMIPDARIEDFLESDVQQIARTYTRTMAPDVELATRFGRVDMEQQFKSVQEEYARLRAALEDGDEKGANKLHAALTRDLRDLSAVRDRLRGTYGLPADPGSIANRTFRVIKDLNYLRILGGMTISALPDVGATVMQHGFLRTFRDGFVPMVSELRQFNLGRQEVKMAGEALDMVLDSRAMSLADVLDDYGRGSKFERGVTALTSKFGLVSLMAPWNAALKQFGGVIAQTRSLRAIAALADGTISQAERTRLAHFGISEEMAGRIHQAVLEHGSPSDSGHLTWANTEAWTDNEARVVYRAALANEINKTIVTPGQEKPLWMSTNLGKVLGQFRSFNLSSMQRVTMAGLQKRDMATLNGTAMMVGLGSVVYWLKSDHDKVSDDPAVWVKEGLDRSGVTGWLFDINNMVEKFTGGAVGASRVVNGPLSSRYASRGVLASVLGPTASIVEDLAQITASATRNATGAPEPWKQADSHAVRRMIPLQNLIGFKYLFDAAERGINDSMGVPMKAGK